MTHDEKLAILQRSLEAREQDDADKAGMTVVELRSSRAAQKIAKAIAADEALAAANTVNAEIPLRILDTCTGPLISTPALVAAMTCDVAILVMSGGPGAGKSLAAVVWLLTAHAQRYADHSPDGYASWGAGGMGWVAAAELARIAYDSKKIEQLQTVVSLVIDDLGTEYSDERGRFLSTFAEIVEDRYANERPTVITTNLGPDDFRARYGARLASRMAEDGAFVGCGGTDLRRVGGAR